MLASNLSKEGMFLRMPTPFDAGTKVALSLEAGGRVLPFAQAEVVWRDLDEAKSPGRAAGFGVRFTGFLHPRAHELVDYLVTNLETGKPLNAPVAASAWRKRLVWIAAGLAAVIIGGVLTTAAFRFFRTPAGAVVAAVEAPAAEAVVVVAPVVDAAPVLEVAPAMEYPLVEPPIEAEAAVADVAIEAKVEAPRKAAPAPEGLSEAVLVEPAKPELQTVKIPSGSVRSISAKVEGDRLSLSLTLASGASITNAFTLRNPERLAIDVRGPAPKLSHVVKGTGVVQKVRIGKLPRGTRVVLDLARSTGTPVVVSGTSVSVPLR